MKKVKIAVTFLCAMSLCVSAMAQVPIGAPPPLPEQHRATAGQIATLLDVMRVKDQMAEMLDMLPAIIQQQMQKQREALRGLRLTREEDELIEKLLQRNIERSLNLYPIEEIISDTGMVYQKYISREDADILIAFYKTPAAQRLIDVQPAMMQEALPMVMSRLETRIQAFSQETARELQELLKKLEGKR